MTRSRGFTLVDFMLGLVVSGVIAAVVLAVGVSRLRDQDTADAIAGVAALKAQATAAYSQSMGYMDAAGVPVSAPALYALADRFPRAFTLTPAGAVLDAWGGAVTVTADSSTPTARAPCGGASRPPDDLLRITLAGIPAKACAQMVGALAPQSYDTYVNGSLVALDPAPSSTGPGRSAVRYAQAAPLCHHDQNTVAFRSLKPLALYTLRSYPPTTQLTPSESACTLPEYNRVQNAMAAREAAQLALTAP